MMGYGAFGWLGMGLAMVVFWGAVVFFIFLAVRTFTRPNAPRSSEALHILEERLARAEITPEEFAQRKQTIQSAAWEPR